MALRFFISTLFLFFLAAHIQASPAFPPGMVERLRARGIDISNATLPDLVSTFNGTGLDAYGNATSDGEWDGRDKCMDRRSNAAYQLTVARSIDAQHELEAFCSWAKGVEGGGRSRQAWIAYPEVNLREIHRDVYDQSRDTWFYAEYYFNDAGPSSKTVHIVDEQKCIEAARSLIGKCQYPIGQYPAVAMVHNNRIMGGWREYKWGWFWFLASSKQGPWCPKTETCF